MAEFRKLFLVLAVVALFVSTASAQEAFTCNASAVPVQVRSEGLTELVGDVLFNCSKTTPLVSAITANITINLTNTTISSNRDGSTTEAILMIGDPAPADQRGSAPGQNVFKGLRLTDNIIEWRGVPIAAAGSNAVVIRITNVRANAAAVPEGAPITGYVTISGSTSVPVNNPNLIVAYTAKGLSVSTGDVLALKQCEPDEEGKQFTVTIKERFATAFKKKIEGTVQDVPGAVYNTESGFVSAASTWAGKADSGTRFAIRFANIPANVSLVVDDISSTGVLDLDEVSGLDGSEVELEDGAGTVVYEVVADSGDTGASDIDEFTITFRAVFPGSPKKAGLTSADALPVVNVAFSPLSTNGLMHKADPEPRFIDTGSDKGIFTISACRTIILFPFVTNMITTDIKLDTGIVISNTSKDPFSTPTQAGPCTIYYFGSNVNSPTTPILDYQISQSVDAGKQLAFVLSTGGSHGMVATPGFQGYIFAVCDFQFAHGYAFISDLGLQKFAQGYLGLIVPDTGDRLPRWNGLVSNSGEQLGN